MKNALLFLVVCTMATVRGQVFIERPNNPPVEVSVFGGDVAEFTLIVESPTDGKILLTYDLFQIANLLLLSIEKDRPAGEIPEKDPRQRLTVRVPIPKVDGPTRMMVNFSMNPPAGKLLLGRSTAWLDVFPKPQPGEWEKAISGAQKRTGRRLAVFGESPSLRALLKAESIPFEDLGREVPDTFPKDRILAGEVTVEEWKKFNLAELTGGALVFASGTELPPGVYRTDFVAHRVTKVTLPVPSFHGASPRERNLFFDLILQQFEP